MTMTFASLGLHEALIRAVDGRRLRQRHRRSRRAAIPPALAGRRPDGLVRAPAAARPRRSSCRRCSASSRRAPTRPSGARRASVYGPRILVLTPTRELAMQVAKAAAIYGRHVQGLRVATVVGGVPYPAQLKALRGPLDILIATPGRLLDHLQTGKARARATSRCWSSTRPTACSTWASSTTSRTIADHVPAARQTVMYSATFAGHVGRLAQNLLRDPQRVDVASHTDTHANIEQRLHWADNGAHKNALLDHILTEREMEQALVFTSTQRDADWLADRLADMGHAVASLHGGMPQGRRNRVLHGAALAAAARAGRDRRRGARHRRADDQPRHQLRPADEGRRTTCTASAAPAAPAATAWR